MEINILGTTYSVIRMNYNEYPDFKEKSCDGQCDSIMKKITLCRIKTFPGYENESDEFCELVEKEVLRHEIVHAFFNESGLQGSSNVFGDAWTKNEEMIDWIALQAPKLMKAMKDADCL